jgi:hypothetical protein
VTDPRLIELRELLMNAPESTSTRVLFVSLSLVLVATVLFLVKRRTLREEYTPIWLGVALAITVLSLFPSLLYFVTRSIGAWTPSSALFFFGELFLVAVCLNYAVRLSKLTVQMKNLAQELAVLREEFERSARPSEAE